MHLAWGGSAWLGGQSFTWGAAPGDTGLRDLLLICGGFLVPLSVTSRWVLERERWVLVRAAMAGAG